MVLFLTNYNVFVNNIHLFYQIVIIGYNIFVSQNYISKFKIKK